MHPAMVPGSHSTLYYHVMFLAFVRTALMSMYGSSPAQSVLYDDRLTIKGHLSPLLWNEILLDKCVAVRFK